MKDITSFPANKITLDELQEYFRIEEYSILVETVFRLMEENRIEPVKSSRLNGKKPALHVTYRIMRKSSYHDSWEKEIQYLAPELNGDYYRKHQDVYKNDREFVLKLNQFCLQKKDSLQQPVSINERSFEIFGREKFLLKEGGGRILRNLGRSLDDLNCYETSQPLAYYSHKKQEGQNMLMIENKDTFYSMRKHLLDGNEQILGIPVGTIIYGGGKGIYRSLQDFDLCVEPYMRSNANIIFYFGDLDYEGILIYEQVREIIGETLRIIPFIEAYEKMLEKAKKILLPVSKEHQNRNCGSEFFGHFREEITVRMKNILESGNYIPQEILRIQDL